MTNGKTKFLALLGRANKKAIIAVSIVVILILVLGLGVLAANWKIKQMSSAGYFNTSQSGRMMGQGKNLMFYRAQDSNQFVLPQDAAKSGELAIMVNNLDNAKNGIADVAVKNGGNVYTTQISYLSGNIKNGSIVIQVPSENFDTTFGALKKIGGQIVQESTKQIPEMNSMFPQPLSAPAVGIESSPTVSESPTSTTGNSTASKKTTTSDQTASSASAGDTASQVLISPMPFYKQIVQDKGYIKVIFVDYGASGYGTGATKNTANMVGAGYVGQNMRNNIWVVMAIKSILLIVLIAVLFVIARKITQSVKKMREKKATVRGVKQSSRNRARVIRIKKR